jgi:(4S)-4-hydroxy-5-phosphonooxypentane-2,3-dione isomerase
VADFERLFVANKDKIAAFEGCLHLEILRDIDTPNIYFTYSKWQSKDDIEAYRQSKLFNGIWSNVKPLFSGKPEAWSVA